MVRSRALCALLLLCGLADAQAAPPLAPEDGGPLHWEVTGVNSGLNLRDRPSTDGAVIERLSPGAVLANLGCLSAEGRDWCDVQPFRGGGWTNNSSDMRCAVRGTYTPYGRLNNSGIRLVLPAN